MCGTFAAVNTRTSPGTVCSSLLASKGNHRCANTGSDTVHFSPRLTVQDGTLCLDLIQDQWSPVQSVSTLLTSVQSLLTDPNCSVRP